MPQTLNITFTQNYTIPSDIHSIRIRLFGASGAGEFVRDESQNFAATAGGNGTATTFMGLSAGGGTGGGQGGKNLGGNGGIAQQIYNWTNLGATVTTVSGSTGQIATGGAGGSVGSITGIKGGNGTPGGAAYTSFVFHVFDNVNNVHQVTDTSSDINVTYQNPGAADGIPCGTPWYGKYYSISFNSPFVDNNYTISIYDICQQAAAGGTSGGPFVLDGINNKTRYGFNVWFCRSGATNSSGGSGSNGYVRCFTIAADGIKENAAGRGGGGGAALQTTLTREMLISSGTYAPQTTHSLTIGSRGLSANSGSADDGLNGKAELYIILVPRITINATSTAIVRGNSTNISWSTSGDASTFSLNPGNLSSSLTGNVNVSPTQTTTYTATASGLGGTDTKTITITVYQPPQANISGPASIDYGTQAFITYDNTYANSSVTATPTYYYDSPTGSVVGTSINLNKGTSTELNDPAAYASGTFQTAIPYTTKGPRSVMYTITASGSGGQVTKQVTIPINIDELPDSIVIPETEDAFKSQDPVYSPPDPTSQQVRINDIDIPVEIKSNYPIQVDINNQSNWQNVRQI